MTTRPRLFASQSGGGFKPPSRISEGVADSIRRRPRRDLLHLGLLSGGYSLVAAFLLVTSACGSPDPDPAPYQKAADKIRPLFEKKKAPQWGDWLQSHPEAGQTFAQYLKSHPTRLPAGRTKLYLQPIGDFTPAENAMLPDLKEFMHLIFGTEVVTLEKIGLDQIPDTARREVKSSGAKQILSTYVLDHILLPKRPKDAVAVLAITPSDLWPGEGWNFVFGQASLEERVGVWSTARFGDPDKDSAKYLRRVLQVAIHETGHMFGIEHCTAYECCMNGSNSLAESDGTPLVFCPECDAKLWWARKLNPSSRAKELAEFAQRHALAPEAKQWTRIAKALE